MLQPVLPGLSKLLLARWITRGPLRNKGILDLTALRNGSLLRTQWQCCRCELRGITTWPQPFCSVPQYHGRRVPSCIFWMRRPGHNNMSSLGYFNVDPFGKLVVHSKHDVSVQPADPQKYPTMDKAFVNMPEKLMSCEVSADGKEVKVTDVSDKAVSEESRKVTSLEIVIPMKYDLNIHMQDKGSASVAGMESQAIVIKTEEGHCSLTKVKAANVRAVTKGGKITCQGALQANVDLKTSGSGAIEAGKLQSQDLSAQSENGNIKVASVYAQSSKFKSTKGNVHIGSCHGNSAITVEDFGDVSVGSLDGSLKVRVQNGNVDVHITRSDNVDIGTLQGNITLKLADCLQSCLSLLGGKIIVDEKVKISNKRLVAMDDGQHLSGTVGDGAFDNRGEGVDTETNIIGKIKAKTCNGLVTIETQDWLTSLKLKNR